MKINFEEGIGDIEQTETKNQEIKKNIDLKINEQTIAILNVTLKYLKLMFFMFFQNFGDF